MNYSGHRAAVYASIILLTILHQSSCYITNNGSTTNNYNRTEQQHQTRNTNNTNKGLPQMLRNKATPLHKILYMSVNYIDKMLTSLMDTNSSGGRQVIASRFTITLGTLLVVTLVTILTLFGFGGIGFIAAKALFVGSLALFLTSVHGFKQHRKSDHDSGGHYVHYVPVTTGHHYQDTSSFSFQKDDEFASHYRG